MRWPWGRSPVNLGLTVATAIQIWFSSVLFGITLTWEWMSNRYTYVRVTVRSNLDWNSSEELLFLVFTERENPEASLGSGTLYLRVAWEG